MKRITALILAVLMVLTCAVYVQAAPTGPYQVTVYFNTGAGSLALRNAPNGSTMASIPYGTSLEITLVQSGWGQVTYNGMTGWVSLHDTKVAGEYPAPQTGFGSSFPVYYTVYNTEGEGLELRTDPTTDSSTFGPMYDGTVIRTEGRSGEWVYGKGNGRYGWCHTHYLRGSTQAEITAYEAKEAQSTPPVTGTIPTDQGYQQAYIDLLNANAESIRLYEQQSGSDGSKTVALQDITGDGIPELIYLCMQQQGVAMMNPQLHIVTFENGQTRELFADNWGRPVSSGGYFHFYLFMMEGKSHLYYYTDDGGDGGTVTYGRFDVTENGTLVLSSLFEDRDLGSAAGNSHEYYKVGESVSQDEYQSQIQFAQQSTSSVLMYTDGCGDFLENYVAQNGCDHLTLDEALSMLAGN